MLTRDERCGIIITSPIITLVLYHDRTTKARGEEKMEVKRDARKPEKRRSPAGSQSGGRVSVADRPALGKVGAVYDPIHAARSDRRTAAAVPFCHCSTASRAGIKKAARTGRRSPANPEKPELVLNILWNFCKFTFIVERKRSTIRRFGGMGRGTNFNRFRKITTRPPGQPAESERKRCTSKPYRKAESRWK